MLLNNHSDNDDFIKFIHTGDALFHYTSKVTVIEKILLHQTLKFGKFSRTNDPQEYRPKLSGAGGWGWGDTTLPLVYETANLLESLFHEYSRFISFCTNSFEEKHIVKDSGLLKARMWAQYGDNHQGACLVISKTKLLKILKEQFQCKCHLLHSAVQYIDPDNRGNPIQELSAGDFKKTSCYELATAHLIKHQDKLLFSKQFDYRDENEFRIVCIPKEDATIEIKVPLNEILEGIIFGDRFPDLYEPAITELTKVIDIYVKQLHWDKNGYYLWDLKNTSGFITDKADNHTVRPSN
jgi:hypothetical protein